MMMVNCPCCLVVVVVTVVIFLIAFFMTLYGLSENVRVRVRGLG
jgi:hypothetical protein